MKAAAVALVFFLFTTLTSATEFRGQILDRHSAPIPGVQVTLGNLKAETDQNGYFHLEGTAIIPSLGQSSKEMQIHTTNGSVRIISKERTAAKIRIVDATGRSINVGSMPDKSGNYSIDLKNCSMKLLFLQIETHGGKTILPFMNGFRSKYSFSANKHTTGAASMGKSLSYTDTILCTKQGFLPKRVAVDISQTGLVLHMYPDAVDITSADYPVIDGSTSTQPVGIVLAATLLGTSYGYSEIMDGSKRMMAYSSSKPQLADSINNYIVKHNTTHDAYVNVIDGTAKLGLVARLPSEDELAHAESSAVELSVVPFALDAFTFLLNRKNPVENLTIEDIRKIYTGETTNWLSVGGHDLAIRPYQRERNSGSQEMMMSMVMKDLTIINSPNMIVNSMMGPFNALALDTTGIGYTVYFYGKNMAPDHTVKFSSVDGIFPNYENIKSKRYSLWADVYLICRNDLDPSALAAHLREFILAPAGQQVVKASGYVPIYEE